MMLSSLTHKLQSLNIEQKHHCHSPNPGSAINHRTTIEKYVAFQTRWQCEHIEKFKICLHCL